jgi:hypothetical protein
MVDLAMKKGKTEQKAMSLAMMFIQKPGKHL